MREAALALNAAGDGRDSDGGAAVL
jgi:hypothetical protein